MMDYCNKVSVQISSHQTTRGDQVKRVNKHPQVDDHKWGLREGDEMEFYDLKEITVNLRNFYVSLQISPKSYPFSPGIMGRIWFIRISFVLISSIHSDLIAFNF